MTATTNQTKIHEKLEEFLQRATEEDVRVLQSVLDGFNKKQNGEVSTYLEGLTDVSGKMIDEKTYEMTLPITPLVLNPLFIVHGGITATLADSAMGTLVGHLLPEGKKAVTSEIKLNYISPGVGKMLKCIATALHVGKKTCVTEAKIYTEEGKLAATASGSFFII